jgi:hypothetical protein
MMNACEIKNDIAKSGCDSAEVEDPVLSCKKAAQQETRNEIAVEHQ